jgi:hypothetical protein
MKGMNQLRQSDGVVGAWSGDWLESIHLGDGRIISGYHGASLKKAIDLAPHIIPEFVLNNNREMLEYFWQQGVIDPYVVRTTTCFITQRGTTTSNLFGTW